MIPDPPPTSSNSLKKKTKKTYNTWKVTGDRWHTTHDTWHVTGGEHYVKCQVPSSNGLGFMVFWKFGAKEWLTWSVNKLFSDVGVCSTDPATPSLLNTLCCSGLGHSKFLRIRRYDPLREPTPSSCGGLRPSAEAFYASSLLCCFGPFLAIFDARS